MGVKWARIGPVLWLAAVWVLLWGTLSPMSIAGGLLIGVLVIAVFPQPDARFGVTLRPLAACSLAWHFTVDVVRASIHVAWLAIRPGTPPGGIVVDVTLASSNELLQTVTAEMTGLVPGSVVIDLDSETRVLTLHLIDVTTSEQARHMKARVLEQEARVRKAFDPTYEGDSRARV